MKKLLLPLAAILLTVGYLIRENFTGRRYPGNSSIYESYLSDIKAKEERRKAGYTKKFDEPNKYVEFHRDIRTRDAEEFMGYKSGYRLVELEKMQQQAMLKGSKNILPWVERGPANVPGRTRGLIVDPDDPTSRTWFAGSVGGGIWKTTNEGGTWTKLTPDFPNLAISWLAMAPSNSNVIYAGTGEGFFAIGMIDGDGIFKSTNKGNTWTQLASTAGTDDFQNVNRIIIDPGNENILLACTNTGSLNEFASGIYKSDDGGLNWRKVYNSPRPRRVQQLVYHPNNFTVQYAAVYGQGVLKSTDAGETWQNSSTGMSPNGRVEIAVAPTNPNRLFASCEGTLSGVGSDLYISDDAGATWSLVRAPAGATTYDFLGGQGWFDNTIAVDLYDDKKVYVAGVNIFRASMRSESTTNPPNFIGLDEENTGSFINLINFGGDFYGGRLAKGNAAAADFVSVEVRFGPGKTQKAHRFTVPPTAGTNGDGGAGVPANQYQNYADVPFEVWDIANNRQLMVSFRDQERDGKWDLEPRHPTIDSKAREYIFIHAIPYSATANSNIAVNGGHTHNQMYFFWPVLPDNRTFEPDNLPESAIRIKWGSLTVRFADWSVISDAYNQFSNPGKNNYGLGEFNMHPDQHNLVMIPVNPALKTYKLLVANDGGVFISKTSTQPGMANNDFIFTGQSFNTTQFYGADKAPGVNCYIGGSQDNGTWYSPQGESASKITNYIPAIGGDGFEVVWHYRNAQRIIGGSQYNGFRRTTNGGASWVNARTGLLDVGQERAPFISRLANSKSNPDVLYAVGSTGLWKSYNFGESWFSKPISENWAFGSYSNVKISTANYNIVWAGGAMRSNGRIYVSKDGGHTFNPAANYTEVPLGRISGLATHSTEDSTAYVLFSFAKAPKILRTTNLGQTWEDISGFGTGTTSSNGFPDVAVYSLLMMPHDPNVLWAGTEIGIVESLNNGATWALANNGLPATSVWELKVVDDQVVAATHGRGIWSVTIPEIKRVPFITEFSRQTTTTNVNLQVNMRALYDSVQVIINKQRIKSYLSPIAGLNSDVIQLPVDGAYNCYVVAWINETPYKSASNNITNEIFTGINPVNSERPEELNIYPNPSQGMVWFELPGEGGLINVEVYSVSGQKLFTDIVRKDTENFVQLPARLTGGYYVFVVRYAGKVYSQRMLLNW